jgi:hypothetical protein
MIKGVGKMYCDGELAARVKGGLTRKEWNGALRHFAPEINPFTPHRSAPPALPLVVPPLPIPFRSLHYLLALGN